MTEYETKSLELQRYHVLLTALVATAAVTESTVFTQKQKTEAEMRIEIITSLVAADGLTDTVRRSKL